LRERTAQHQERLHAVGQLLIKFLHLLADRLDIAHAPITEREDKYDEQHEGDNERRQSRRKRLMHERRQPARRAFRTHRRWRFSGLRRQAAVNHAPAPIRLLIFGLPLHKNSDE
jgi:hypothetical protein